MKRQWNILYVTYTYIYKKWELLDDVLRAVLKRVHRRERSVKDELWRPCFSSLFLLFLPSLSTSLLTFLLQGTLASNCSISRTAQVQITHPKYRFSWHDTEERQHRKLGMVLECVVFGSVQLTGFVPLFCVRYCTILWSRGGRDSFFWHARREVPTCNVMYKWRAAAVQVWAVNSHHPQLPALRMQLWKLSEGQVSAVRADLAGRFPRLDLVCGCLGSFKRCLVVSNSPAGCLAFALIVTFTPKLEHQNKKKKGESHLSNSIILFLREAATTLMVALFRDSRWESRIESH